jgi:hypothetical protein
MDHTWRGSAAVPVDRIAVDRIARYSARAQKIDLF